jgi:hypothetical protein
MGDAEFLRYLKDKNAIEKLVFSYATALDQRQLHLLTPMATDNLHFNYGGVFVTLNRCPSTTQCYGCLAIPQPPVATPLTASPQSSFVQSINFVADFVST